MLPDDLENLAESAVATSLFSNNILQALTTKNYWNVVNDFKPLMHTWSLGVEEQYYFLYPILFLIFSGKKLKFILPTLVFITVLSLVLFIAPFFSTSAKFYYLPFRFFELSFGGITAILIKEKIVNVNKKFSILSSLFLFILMLILVYDISIIPNSIQLLLTVFSTCIILVFTNNGKNLSCLILQNKPMVFIGNISFSLYMWHQFFVAFVRYFIIAELTAFNYAIILIITFIASICSYYFIEQPFRDKNKVNNMLLFSALIPTIILTLSVSIFLYFRAGVIKDVPELDITKSNVSRNFHAKYNDKIYSYDHDFLTNDKLKILVIGNSFARDFANILLESKYSNDIEISYVFNYADPKTIKRITEADLVFLSTFDKNNINISGIDFEKIYCIGTKNFGSNNGIFYNYKGENYYEQRTPMIKGTLDLNNNLKTQWGSKFIDLIGYVIDENNKMPVFTPDHRFISQDCSHLVRAGAQYYSTLLDNDKNFILNIILKK